MFIQNVFATNLNLSNKQKMKSDLKNNNKYVCVNPTTFKSNDDNINNEKNKTEFSKKQLKKAYWMGVLSGLVFAILSIGGDHLCEYLIKKNSTKLK